MKELYMFMRIVISIGLVGFLVGDLESFQTSKDALEYISLHYDLVIKLGFQKQLAKLSSEEQEELFVNMFQIINQNESIYLEDIALDIKDCEAIVDEDSYNVSKAKKQYLQKAISSLDFFYRYAKKHKSFYRFLHAIHVLQEDFYADEVVFNNKGEASPAKVLGERYRIYENAKYPVMEYADKLDRNIKKLSKLSKRSGKNCVQKYIEKVCIQGKALHAKVLADKDYRAECKVHQEFHPKRLIAEKTLVAAFASLWMGAMLVTGIVYAAIFAQS